MCWFSSLNQHIYALTNSLYSWVNEWKIKASFKKTHKKCIFCLYIVYIWKIEKGMEEHIPGC